jgi:hypothetical protein
VPASDLANFCAFAVMAKAPRPGEVKSRLVPPLLSEEAAALSETSIQDVADNFLVAGRRVNAYGYVAHSPPGSEVLFRELVPPEIELLAPRLIGLGCGLGDASPLWDPLHGRNALARLGMREMTYGWTLEMQMRAARAGRRILEVPAAHRRRLGGSSKGTIPGTLKAGLRIAATLFWVAFETGRDDGVPAATGRR